MASSRYLTKTNLTLEHVFPHQIARNGTLSIQHLPVGLWIQTRSGSKFPVHWWFQWAFQARFDLGTTFLVGEPIEPALENNTLVHENQLGPSLVETPTIHHSANHLSHIPATRG